MSLAQEFLLDAIEADRAADRARIRYVHDVREVLARSNPAAVPTASSLSGRLLVLLRARISPRGSAGRSTG
jgi:hypothetical protein